MNWTKADNQIEVSFLLLSLFFLYYYYFFNIKLTTIIFTRNYTISTYKINFIISKPIKLTSLYLNLSRCLCSTLPFIRGSCTYSAQVIIMHFINLFINVRQIRLIKHVLYKLLSHRKCYINLIYLIVFRKISTLLRDGTRILSWCQNMNQMFFTIQE